VRLDDTPLFAMLKSRMGWLNERQRLVAQNVAHADTPGYVPKDLKGFSFAQAMAAQAGGTGVARTHAGHLSGSGGAPSRFESTAAPDSETTLDGNAVVLEEQMLKMAESRMAYDAAIGFYQKSMNMLRMAAKPPGR